MNLFYLLQSATACYYKVRQLYFYCKVLQVLLQSATIITTCDRTEMKFSVEDKVAINKQTQSTFLSLANLGNTVAETLFLVIFLLWLTDWRMQKFDSVKQKCLTFDLIQKHFLCKLCIHNNLALWLNGLWLNWQTFVSAAMFQQCFLVNPGP